jgi:SAM-dependent methyltransferase
MIRDTCWTSLPVIADETMFDPAAKTSQAAATALSLGDITPLLVSPDTGDALVNDEGGLRSHAGECFPLDRGCPILLPGKIRDRVFNVAMPLAESTIQTALDQYLLLAQIKNAMGEANTISSDPWYRRHLHRSRVMLEAASGLVLDIGCDDPDLGRRLFPASASYVGLEPSLGLQGPFRISAMAEFLPFRDACFDGVAFLTSLDHILDYHRALDEAMRVLKPGGMLFLASLIWTERAELYHDTIHFHHFREFELRGALSALEVTAINRYCWKHDTHRTGIYLAARKPT